MDGSTVLRALRPTWWIVVVAVVAAAGAALLLASQQETRYQSVATYVVSPSQGEPAAVTESVRTLDPARARALVATYVEILTSTAVQDEAAGAYGLSTFPEEYEVTAVVAPEAYVAELRVVGPQPDDAAALAEAIGGEASARFVGLYQIYDVVELDPASVPDEPIGRGLLETVLLGAALGLVVGLGIAILAGAPRVRRRRHMQTRLEAYGGADATVTLLPADRREPRAG